MFLTYVQKLREKKLSKVPKSTPKIKNEDPYNLISCGQNSDMHNMAEIKKRKCATLWERE